ncbi:CAS1 domain-containing protein [Dactylonectria estremocensis]|uniref:CAS1 domain-containing protein n=1 Tax=Dactylonectria estremocensis TaxID=1079267 RepID=A0A9P9FHW5_9HYPO|nr:CAS1 domain-containing protein [Dactylonectria estremocensis]
MWSQVLSRIVFIVFAVVLLAAVGFKTAFPGDDPYRCRAVLETGQWIDRPDAEGNRAPFRNWQPDGCMLHQYSSADIRQCMDGRHIVFIGDSTSRGVAYGLARLLEREEALYDSSRISPSVEFNITYHGVRIQRMSNVWLQTNGYPAQNSSVYQLSVFSDELKKTPSIKKQKGAAMVYMAAGAWYSNLGASREMRLKNYHEAVLNASEIIGDAGKNIFTDPMDPFDGVGNQVFFSPPSGPRYLGDKPGKIKDINRRRKDLRLMQDWLRESTDDLNFPLVWAMPELVEDQDMVWRDPLGTGFHVINQVAEVRANILLNARCNAKLDRLKRYPYNRTCCTDYGNKPLVQLGFVAFGLVWLAACIIGEIVDLVAKQDEPRFSLLNMQAGCFIMAPLMCYYADRTQLMAKGAKVWIFNDFVLLCIPCVILALVTIRRSRSATRTDPLFIQPDQPFLSRDQTDEWKGWMQFIILIYHWVSSQSDSIYMLVRLLVAAYLFQTGYGHTQFFLKKADFGFKRVASVLLRLNLLACTLAYFMNTDYMFYYFSPLVTFWFLVVYATMAIGHEKLNDDIQWVLAKIFISALLVSGIALATPVTNWVFYILRHVFFIQWSLGEWKYRLALDIFIVYVGMLFGVANYKFQGTVILGLRIVLAIVGFAAGFAYFYVNWKDYRTWHPYASFVPILAFIAIRNVTTMTRNYHSKAMAWLGRCSLETYTLQFHLLLAADTQGVLLVDGFNNGGDVLGRWKSLIVIVPVFLWISSAAATGTGHLVKVILRQSSSSSEKMSGPNGARFMERIAAPSSYSFFSSLQFRFGLLLVTLWLLNFMSPALLKSPVPDGFTPHRVQAGAPGGAVSTPVPTPH